MEMERNRKKKEDGKMDTKTAKKFVAVEQKKVKSPDTDKREKKQADNEPLVQQTLAPLLSEIQSIGAAKPCPYCGTRFKSALESHITESHKEIADQVDPRKIAKRVNFLHSRGVTRIPECFVENEMEIVPKQLYSFLNKCGIEIIPNGSTADAILRDIMPEPATAMENESEKSSTENPVPRERVQPEQSQSFRKTINTIVGRQIYKKSKVERILTEFFARESNTRRPANYVSNVIRLMTYAYHETGPAFRRDWREVITNYDPMFEFLQTYEQTGGSASSTKNYANNILSALKYFKERAIAESWSSTIKNKLKVAVKAWKRWILRHRSLVGRETLRRGEKKLKFLKTENLKKLMTEVHETIRGLRPHAEAALIGLKERLPTRGAISIKREKVKRRSQGSLKNNYTPESLRIAKDWNTLSNYLAINTTVLTANRTGVVVNMTKDEVKQARYYSKDDLRIIGVERHKTSATSMAYVCVEADVWPMFMDYLKMRERVHPCSTQAFLINTEGNPLDRFIMGFKRVLKDNNLPELSVTRYRSLVSTLADTAERLESSSSSKRDVAQAMCHSEATAEKNYRLPTMERIAKAYKTVKDLITSVTQSSAPEDVSTVRMDLSSAEED